MKRKEKDKILEAIARVLHSDLRHYEYKRHDGSLASAFLKNMRYYLIMTHEDYKTLTPIFHALTDEKYSFGVDVEIKFSGVLSEFALAGADDVRMYFRQIEDIYIMNHRLRQVYMGIDTMYKKIPYDKFYGLYNGKEVGVIDEVC